MAQPALIEAVQETDVVELEDGRAAIRTSTKRGEDGRGGGTQIEYLAFTDPHDGLRIARDLATLCMSKTEK